MAAGDRHGLTPRRELSARGSGIGVAAPFHAAPLHLTTFMLPPPFHAAPLRAAPLHLTTFMPCSPQGDADPAGDDDGKMAWADGGTA